MTKRRACRIWPLLALAALGCTEPDPGIPLLDRSVFFGSTEAANGLLSPDGRYLVYARPFGGRLNLWLRPLYEEGGEERPVTRSSKDSVGQFAFSADGERIIFSRDESGDEAEHLLTVRFLDPDAVPLDLTPIDGVKARLIALPDSQPDLALVGLNERDERYHDVYAISLTDGKRTLLRKNEEGYSRWWTNRDGELALALLLEDDGTSAIYDVTADPARLVLRCAFTEVCAPQQFHPSKARFYMISNRGDVDLTQLYLVDPEYGSLEPVHRDPLGIADVGHVLFSRESGRLLGVSYLGDRQRVYSLDPDFARDLKIVSASLPNADLVFRSPTRNDRYWIVKEIIDVDEGSNYLYDRVSTAIKPLYESFPDIPRESTTRRRAVRYTARDGSEIPAYLTRPRDWRKHQSLPVVVIVHGGPWTRDTWGWDAEAQFLANRGYLVLQPNFRGSTGYGKDFLNAGYGQWGTGVMQTDVEDGIRWLVDQGRADPERIAIKGVSYGGYAALAGLTFTPDLFAAGVAVAAPADLATLVRSIPAYWQPQQTLLHRRIGDPDTDSARLRAASPLFASDKIRAPLMLMQGANDPRVPRSQSDRMASAAHAAGAEVSYLLSEDQGHTFGGRDRLVAMAAMEHFLARHLGGRAQPLSTDLKRRIEDLSVDVSRLPRRSATMP